MAGDCSGRLGDDSGAEEFLQDAIATFRRLGNKVQYAYAVNNYVCSRKKICEYGESERLFKKAFELFVSFGAMEGQVLCCGIWGYCASER